GGFSEPLDSALERRLGADLVVIHLAVSVASGVLGLATEYVAHEQVVDARALDMILEQIFRELRFELRVRRGAHVNQVLNAVRLERRQELLQRARAVANCEKRLLAALARRHCRPLLVTAIHDKSISRLNDLGRNCRPDQGLRPGRPRNSSIKRRMPSRISNNSFRASAIIVSGRSFLGATASSPP